MSRARTLMWEARAADGRAPELLAWLLEAAPRGEVFTSGDRVVLVLDLDPELDPDLDPGDEGGRVPEPPGELVARPPHAWAFTRVREA